MLDIPYRVIRWLGSSMVTGFVVGDVQVSGLDIGSHAIGGVTGGGEDVRGRGVSLNTGVVFRQDYCASFDSIVDRTGVSG